VHIGQSDVAERVHNAWLRTIEDGIHTYDIFTEGVSKEKVGTKEFAAAVVARLGKIPEKLKPVHYAAADSEQKPPAEVEMRKAGETRIDGIDVYVEWPSADPNSLAVVAQQANGDGLKLIMISNRGVKVWPDGLPETFCTDSFRLRYIAGGATTIRKTIDLLGRVDAHGLQIVKTEGLRTYDGQPGYSLAQGQ